MSAKKKQISQATYLQALGLFTLANRTYLKAQEYESALAKLLKYPEPYLNHLSDEIVEPRANFDDALKREGYVVRKAKK